MHNGLTLLQTNRKMSEKSKHKINWTTEKIMSSSALFISVISLIALLYQSYLAREENKLNQKQQSASVLPYLSQWFSSSDGFKIIIGNKGVGPAFVREVTIVYDSIHNFSNTDDLFRHVFKTNRSLDSVRSVTSTFKEGYVLPANETIELIKIFDAKGKRAFRKILTTKHLFFSIEYEDIYGARWELSSSEDINVPRRIED